MERHNKKKQDQNVKYFHGMKNQQKQGREGRRNKHRRSDSRSNSRRKSRSRHKRRRHRSRDQDRKKQGRLAKARILAQIGVDKGGQFKDEDDLDMPEIENKQEEREKQVFQEMQKQEEDEYEEGQIIEKQHNIIQMQSKQQKTKKLVLKDSSTSIFNNRFTEMKQSEDQEEDPFDAYMKQIETEAAHQENVTHPMAQKEEVNNVITLEDLDRQEEVEEDEEYEQRFMTEWKKKDQLDRLNQQEKRIYNDEDDRFIMKIGQDEDDADDFLQKEKKKLEQKEINSLGIQEFEVIKKNIYIETKEISMMTDKEVAQYRKGYGDIKVRGVKCAKPIQNWYQCGLSDPILDLLDKKGFEKPFPIQCQAIPAIMSGRDLIGIAETGSGKTLAYVLPMLRHILDQRQIEDGEGMVGLVMAPTRELAFQIYRETKQFAKVCNLRVACVQGGTNIQGQLTELKRGVEIVVCTPGRMIDILTTSNGKITNLKRVSYIVLDEADRMLDMGFEPQINKMIQNVRPDKQCVMLSATFPRQIETLAKKILQSPLEIVVGNRGSTCTNITQYVEVIQQEEKFLRLLQLLGEWYDSFGGILIFVEKQIDADELFKELYKVGYFCLILHGGQDQTDRDFTIQDFKDQVRKIMIATKVCARGLDIRHLKMVINYNCPTHLEDYVHRVGRTGRAGEKGTAYTFITEDDCQYASDLIKALENSQQQVSEQLRDLDKLYIQRVNEGEIDRKKNIGYIGNGYIFSKEEEQKVKNHRKELSKGYLGIDEVEVLEDVEMNQGRQEQEEDERTEELKKLEELLKRDSNAKQEAMRAGNIASRNAIQSGLSHDEAQKVVLETMLNVLRQYKPAIVTYDRGLDQAIQIRDQFIAQENERNNIFTAEIEINDYPQQARLKSTNKEYLLSIYEMTGCKVSCKGQYYEIGRKPPIGQRRQFLYIEGSSKQEVANAYKEMKRYLEENSISQQNYSLNFSGSFGKF